MGSRVGGSAGLGFGQRDAGCEYKRVPRSIGAGVWACPERAEGCVPQPPFSSPRLGAGVDCHLSELPQVLTWIPARGPELHFTLRGPPQAHLKYS